MTNAFTASPTRCIAIYGTSPADVTRQIDGMTGQIVSGLLVCSVTPLTNYGPFLAGSGNYQGMWVKLVRIEGVVAGS